MLPIMSNDGTFEEGDPSPVDNRPELVRRLHDALERAGMAGVAGSVLMDRVDGEDWLDVGISARTPRELEPAIRDALHGLPIRRLYWREPRPHG